MILQKFTVKLKNSNCSRSFLLHSIALPFVYIEADKSRLDNLVRDNKGHSAFQRGMRLKYLLLVYKLILLFIHISPNELLIVPIIGIKLTL